MSISYIISLLFLIQISNCEWIKVKTTAELETKIKEAKSGDTIELAPVKFENVNLLIDDKDGESGNVISVVGSNNNQTGEYTKVICRDKSNKKHQNRIAFHIKQSSFWRIASMSIENCQKGIWVDESTKISLESLFISNIDEEAIILNNGASDNDIRSTMIKNSKSGIYIGKRAKDWVRNSEGYLEPDKCESNNILSCSFGPNVRQNPITLTEGTCCGSIQSNYFNGEGQLKRDEFKEFAKWAPIYADVAGNNYNFESNSGKLTRNGFVVRGCDNEFQSNYCELTSSKDNDGYCIHQSPLRIHLTNNEKKCENEIQMTNFQKGGEGVSNVHVSRWF